MLEIYDEFELQISCNIRFRLVHLFREYYVSGLHYFWTHTNSVYNAVLSQEANQQQLVYNPNSKYCLLHILIT